MHIPLAELGGKLRSEAIWLVIGTRPEAIKLAPVAHALAVGGLEPALIFTVQHSALDPFEFGLGGYGAARRDCPGDADPHAHVRDVVEALLPLLGEAPDLIVVQG